MTSSETMFNDEELDAAIEGLQFMLDLYRDKQSWEGYPRKLRDGIAAITTLRAQLAETQRELTLMTEIADEGKRLWAEQEDRADRAEAAPRRSRWMRGIADAQDLSVMCCTDADIRARIIAVDIRSQSHDRTALDRHDAKTREKALRMAADELRGQGYGAVVRAIIALIEKKEG